MKKVLLIASAIAMLGAVSCKKDYTCACGEIKYTYENVKKSDAEDACDLQSSLFSLGGVSCELE